MTEETARKIAEALERIAAAAEMGKFQSTVYAQGAPRHAYDPHLWWQIGSYATTSVGLSEEGVG